MLKNQAREFFLKQRLQMDPQILINIGKAWLTQFKRFDFPTLNSLLTYFPILNKKEADPTLCLKWLKEIKTDLKIYYPKINFELNTMFPVEVTTKTEFIKNKWGIFEPLFNINEMTEKNPQINMVFVPLIAMDLNGHRVGYGQGFYDRFFVNYPNIEYKIGFSSFEPIQKITDIQEHDCRLTHGISPNNFYAFK